MVLFAPMKVNKDDFEVKEEHEELEMSEPSLKKKVQSYNVQVHGAPNLDIDMRPIGTKGFTDPLLVS